MTKRTHRLNSLLREVISEVITNEVRNPDVHTLTSVVRVEITPDLHYAKVFISVIGSNADKSQTIDALQKAAGFISVHSSKKVTMRYFPTLTFKIDDTAEKQAKIEELVQKVQKERKSRDG